MWSRSHRIAVVLRVQKARLFQICFKITRDLCDTVCKGYDSMTIRKPPKLLQTVWGVGYQLNAVTG